MMFRVQRVLSSVRTHKPAFSRGSVRFPDEGKGFLKKSSLAARMSTLRPTLSVSPTDCLIDDKITIRVEGLRPNQPITIATRLKEPKRLWTAHAHYLASVDGILDLREAVSIGGTYKGVDPMGLFWSISVADDITARLVKHDVTTPFMMSVSVLEGHTTPTHSDTDVPLAQASVARRYMGQHVTRVPVREGRIRGTLFVPKGSGDEQFPGIIDLYGTTGGLKETRAALLASRGFVTLALAYFNYDDLPKDSGNMDLEYFEEAVDWLNKHTSVIRDHLGVIGLSKGGEMALHISTITDKVKAVISMNSSFYNGTFDHSYKGVPIPCIFPDLQYLETKDGWWIMKNCYNKVSNIEDCYIPVEKSNSAQFLFIHGGDDNLITPNNGPRLIQRLWNHGRKNAELHIYPGAGHLLDAPYTPLCIGHYHKLLGNNLYCGGEAALHAYAQEDAWRKVLRFFNTRLRVHASKL